MHAQYRLTPSYASLKTTFIVLFLLFMSVVMLLDPSEMQALTIRTGEVKNPGQVYFESLIGG